MDLLFPVELRFGLMVIGRCLGYAILCYLWGGCLRAKTVSDYLKIIMYATLLITSYVVLS